MATEFETEVADEQSKFKQKLGQVGRSLKKVDLRGSIEKYPFAAVGIAAGVGAIIGLARPMPHRGPISGALMSALTFVGMRLVKEAAFRELGTYAKNLVMNREGASSDSAASFGAQSSDSGAGVRYTPAL